MTNKVQIDPHQYRNIVFLTGAGISVASGIKPYRGPEGLWNDESLVRLSQGSTLRRHPQEVWRFFSALRRLSASAEPSVTHQFLANLERSLPSGHSLTVITQNIDGLHAKAGSRNVIEFHGSACRTRCLNQDCASLPFDDTAPHEDDVPVCSLCGSIQRPDVVLFQEFIPGRVSADALRAVAACDLFVAVGTSATVWPANQFVRGVFERGVRTVFLNTAPLTEDNIYFREQYIGKAEVILPALFGEGVDPADLGVVPEPDDLEHA